MTNTVMFFVGIVIGIVIGFSIGLVFLMPVLNQVSDLEDLLMRSRSDLQQMQGRIVDMIGK